MKNLFTIFFISLLTFTSFAQKNTQTTSSRGETILVNELTREALAQEPYSEWFDLFYETYQVDQASLEGIGPLIQDITITIFLGTWCGDSKLQVPEFLRIMDELGVGGEQVTLYGLDREMGSPGEHEEGLNITHVPTFIFYRDDTELGRIVEFPEETLEKDLARILMN